MEATDTHTLRLFGWNGLSCQVSNAWSPATLFHDYILFEAPQYPTVGIRWKQTPAPPTPEKVYLSLLRSKKFTIHDRWKIPEETRSSIRTPLELEGFIWSEHQYHGQGIIATDSEEGWVAVIQVYAPRLIESPVIPALLNSISFSGPGSETVFAVFDIGFRVPVGYTLEKYSFMAGRFSLKFAAKRSSLTFLRYKPAGILLKEQTLLQWGQKLVPHLLPTQSERETKQTWERHYTGPAKLLRLLQRKPAHYWQYLSRYPIDNSILGLQYAGRSLPRSPSLEEIAQHYTPR